MDRSEKFDATILSFALTVSLIATVTVFGAAVGTVGAVHPSDAPDMTDEANFTVNFPNPEDHHPDREGQGSIEYFASGADAFAAQDAEEGVWISYIIVHAEYEGEDWIDYSACDVQNTGAFGIDRGNNNSGTNFDEDLLEKREDSQFRDDGVVVDFFEFDDPFGDPPYLAPEDAIVASQGEGSAGGPCLTVTEKPGWYRIAGFLNGTVADNGRDEPPSDSAEEVSLELNSNFLYVCECDSEAEARDELGPPPDEGGEKGPVEDGSTDDGASDDDSSDDSSDDGSTDDGASDDGSTDDGSTDDGSPDDGSGDDGSADDGAGDDGAADDDGSSDGGSADDGSGDDGVDDGSDDDSVADDAGNTGGTPAADGPGFGALAAVIALLAAALLATRCRG